ANSTPEKSHPDYHPSAPIYFEPLNFEDVMEILAVEKPDGVIVQFGGQTPLNLAMKLAEAGVPIIGTTPERIDLAEDRKRFGQLLSELRIRQPVHGTARSLSGARAPAGRSGCPVL